MHDVRIRRIYDFWSPVYDWVPGPSCCRRQRDAVRRMDIRPGQCVLDIGVGTGLALKAWPSFARVTGIDISEGMLRRAQRRNRSGRHESAQLTLANGLALPFAENTFDHILVCHVISVVPDPVKLLAEVRRVGKPDCRVVIINHFQSGNRLVARVEKWLRPVFTRIGWATDVSFEWLTEVTGLMVDYRYKPDSVGLCETAFLTNRLATSAPACA